MSKRIFKALITLTLSFSMMSVYAQETAGSGTQKSTTSTTQKSTSTATSTAKPKPQRPQGPKDKTLQVQGHKKVQRVLHRIVLQQPNLNHKDHKVLKTRH